MIPHTLRQASHEANIVDVSPSEDVLASPAGTHGVPVYPKYGPNLQPWPPNGAPVSRLCRSCRPNPPQATMNEVFDDLHDLLTTENFAKVAVRSPGPFIRHVLTHRHVHESDFRAQKLSIDCTSTAYRSSFESGMEGPWMQANPVGVLHVAAGTTQLQIPRFHYDQI